MTQQGDVHRQHCVPAVCRLGMMPAEGRDLILAGAIPLNKAGFEPFLAKYPELRVRIDLVASNRAEETVESAGPLKRP